MQIGASPSAKDLLKKPEERWGAKRPSLTFEKHPPTGESTYDGHPNDGSPIKIAQRLDTLMTMFQTQQNDIALIKQALKISGPTIGQNVSSANNFQYMSGILEDDKESKVTSGSVSDGSLEL